MTQEKTQLRIANKSALPWERTAAESGVEYDWFLMYRDAAGDHDERVLDVERKATDAPRKRVVSKRFLKLAERHRWAARTEAWSRDRSRTNAVVAHEQSVDIERNVRKLRVEFGQDVAKLAGSLLELVQARVEAAKKNPAEESFSQIKAAAEAVSRVMQAYCDALGIPVVPKGADGNLGGFDLRSMSIADQLRLLAEILGPDALADVRAQIAKAAEERAAAEFQSIREEITRSALIDRAKSNGRVIDV